MTDAMDRTHDEALPIFISQPPPSGGTLDIIEIAEVADRRVEAINRIKLAALRTTNANDWVDEGGRPYLQASGAEKIARVFGVSWRIEPPQAEFLPDGHFCYVVHGTFTLGGASIDAIGYRASNDPFFTVRWDQGGKKITLSPADVDRGNVMRAAYTNCIINGITRILGIRNLTWSELAPLGIIPETRVQYKDKRLREPIPVTETGERLATPAQIRYVCKLLDDAGIEPDQRIARCSEVIGAEISDLNRITLSQAQKIIDRMKGREQ